MVKKFILNNFASFILIHQYKVGIQLHVWVKSSSQSVACILFMCLYLNWKILSRYLANRSALGYYFLLEVSVSYWWNWNNWMSNSFGCFPDGIFFIFKFECLFICVLIFEIFLSPGKLFSWFSSDNEIDCWMWHISNQWFCYPGFGPCLFFNYRFIGCNYYYWVIFFVKFFFYFHKCLWLPGDLKRIPLI